MYALASCNFICITMWETVMRAVDEEMSDARRFAIVHAETQAILVIFVLTPFFLMHVRLIVAARTTIEHCETLAKNPEMSFSYDVGIFGNLRNVLGPHPLLWLLPWRPPVGDGLSFEICTKVNKTTGVQPIRDTAFTP